MEVTDCILMRWFQFDGISESLSSSIHIPQPKISQPYEVITMCLVPLIEVIIEDQEIGKGYRKIAYPRLPSPIRQSLLSNSICLSFLYNGS